jgi:hypothetical protein
MTTGTATVHAAIDQASAPAEELRGLATITLLRRGQGLLSLMVRCQHIGATATQDRRFAAERLRMIAEELQRREA